MFKMPSADERFSQLAPGKDSFNVSSVQIPEAMQRFEKAEQQKEKMMTFLQKKGVSSGEMTKALYKEYFDERMASFRAGRMPGGGGPAVAFRAVAFRVVAFRVVLRAEEDAVVVNRKVPGTRRIWSAPRTGSRRWIRTTTGS